MDIKWSCNLTQIYIGLEKQLRNVQVCSCSALSHVRKKLFSNYYLKNRNTFKIFALMSPSNHEICTSIRKIFDMVGHRSYTEQKQKIHCLLFSVSLL